MDVDFIFKIAAIGIIVTVLNLLLVRFALTLFVEQILFLDFTNDCKVEFLVAHLRFFRSPFCLHCLVGIRQTDNVEMQVGVDGGKEFVFHPNFPVGGGFQEVHATEQGTFTASRRADDNDLFALVDFTTHALENLCIIEIFIDIFNAYHLLSISFR